MRLMVGSEAFEWHAVASQNKIKLQASGVNEAVLLLRDLIRCRYTISMDFVVEQCRVD